MDFSTKAALITGGSSGIGKACAEELLANGIKGVTIADVNDCLGEETTTKLKEMFSKEKVIFVKTDVVNKDSFESAFKKTVETFGSIDLLFNNAGVLNEINWELSVRVNLIGTINGVLLAIDKYLHKYKSGDDAYIINISSAAGLAPLVYGPIYSATKHGVLGLTKSYGINPHLRRNGICVLALCPSATATPLCDYLPKTVKYKDLQEKAATQYSPIMQSANAVAKTAILAIVDNDSGSAWFIEKGVGRKINCNVLLN